jgi:hypothetical protein
LPFSFLWPVAFASVSFVGTRPVGLPDRIILTNG